MAERGILERPKVKAKVMAFVLEGMSDAQVADALGGVVTRQAITYWRHRHQDVLKPATDELNAAIVDVARKDKEARIRHYDAMIDRIEDLIVSRGTGLEAVDYKLLGSGRFAEIREIRRFDAALVREWRGLYRDIAEELGSIPQAAPSVTLNDNRTQTIIYRGLGGIAPEEIG